MTALLISQGKSHGNAAFWLAKKLQLKNIPVVITSLNWPRDELFFYPDGTFEYVQRGTIQEDRSNHFAWHGGAYLLAENTLLGSSQACPQAKREATEALLQVRNAVYADLTPLAKELAAWHHYRHPLYQEDYFHIDLFYNVLPEEKLLVTYAFSSAQALGKELADFLGYNLLSLPKEEAAVGAVGFITYNHYLLLDKRAKKTKQCFSSETSYKILYTPLPLTKTNEHEGTLRCMTHEFPYALDDLLLLPPKESSSFFSVKSAVEAILWEHDFESTYLSNASFFSVYRSLFSKTQLTVAQGLGGRIFFNDALKNEEKRA